MSDPTLQITLTLDAGADLQTMRREFDRAVISNVLARSGTKTKAAKALGIKRESLWRMMKRLEVS